MPRVPEYDADDALDRALHHFWQHGYSNTSIEQLVEATGVQRYGLYQSFGSKHDLFLAALRRYNEIYISHRLRELEQEDASLDAINHTISNLATFSESPLGRFGCLLCNTAVELGARDEASDLEVGRYVTRLRTAFQRTLTTARGNGELDPTTDTAILSDFLSGVVVGASVYARTQVQPGAVRAMLETAIPRINATN